MEERYPIYSEADLTVDAGADAIDETVAKTVKCLEDYYCFSKKLV